jgi:hypothetical protein
MGITAVVQMMVRNDDSGGGTDDGALTLSRFSLAHEKALMVTG